MASSSLVKEKLESYFENANSTSRRMMVDISDYKKKANWNYMNENQQADFLWENLIMKKAPALKVEPRPTKIVQDIFSTLRVSPGEKIVIDEDTTNERPFGCSWRDEHSAPFSWHTKSQLDLRLLDEEDSRDQIPNSLLSENLVVPHEPDKKAISPGAPARPKKGLKPIDTPKKGLKPIETPKRRPPPPPPIPKLPSKTEVPILPNPQNNTPKMVLAGGTLVMIQDVILDKTPVTFTKKSKAASLTLPKEILKTESKIASKNEETIRKSVLSVDDELDSPSKNIPKTGFDFLDNW